MLFAICKVMPLLARIRVRPHSIGHGGGGNADGALGEIVFAAIVAVVLFKMLFRIFANKRNRKMKEIAAKSLVRAELDGWSPDPDTCCHCGAHLSWPQRIVQPMNNQGAARSYSVVEVPIPCCGSCQVDVNRAFNSRSTIRSIVAGIVSGAMSLVAFACFSWLELAQSLGCAVIFFLSTSVVCWLMHLCLLSPGHVLIASYPPVAQLLLKGFRMGRGTGHKTSAVALILGFMTLVAGGAVAGEPSELLPKVWIPDPPGVKRTVEHPFEMMGSNPWLDPSKHLVSAMLGQVFKTVADWDPSAGKSLNGSFPTFAVRALDDRDKDALFSEGQFSRKVRDIARASTSVQRTKVVPRTQHSDRDGEPKLELSFLDGYCALTNDSLAVAVMLASSNQQDHIELISKRYLNVNGRFFYLGIRDFVDGGVEEVKLRAKEHDNRLRDWEREVRECTRTRRLKEFCGDEKRMQEAIEFEIARTAPKPDAFEEFRRVREQIGRLDPGERERITRQVQKRMMDGESAASIEKTVSDTLSRKDGKSSPKAVAWVMALVSAFICLVALVQAFVSESKKAMVDADLK